MKSQKRTPKKTKKTAVKNQGGIQLKKWRKSNKFTIKKAIDFLNIKVGEGTFSRWESGIHIPNDFVKEELKKNINIDLNSWLEIKSYSISTPIPEEKNLNIDKDKIEDKIKKEIQEYSKMKNNTTEITNKNNKKNSQVVIIQNAKDKEVIKRKNFVKFNNIKFMKGKCQDCIFYSMCFSKASSYVVWKNLLEKIIDDNFHCDQGVKGIYKFEEIWVKANKENISKGRLRRKDSSIHLEFIDKFNGNHEYSNLAVVKDADKTCMVKFENIEVLIEG